MGLNLPPEVAAPVLMRQARQEETMARYWYGVEYAYGSSVLNRDGGRADTLRRFTSRAERDTG